MHYAALAVSFVVILWIGRNQWFFGDDWATLVPHNDGNLLLPHVGHWNLVPAMVFPLVRNWLGLGSSLPFLALGLAVVLLLDSRTLDWRIVVAIVGCSLPAPTFSGTAIPVLAAAAIVGWIRHGFLRTAALPAPTMLTYLLWYFLVDWQYPTPHAGIDSISEQPLVSPPHPLSGTPT